MYSASAGHIAFDSAAVLIWSRMIRWTARTPVRLRGRSVRISDMVASSGGTSARSGYTVFPTMSPTVCRVPEWVCVFDTDLSAAAEAAPLTAVASVTPRFPRSMSSNISVFWYWWCA